MSCSVFVLIYILADGAELVGICKNYDANGASFSEIPVIVLNLFELCGLLAELVRLDDTNATRCTFYCTATALTGAASL